MRKGIGEGLGVFMKMKRGVKDKLIVEGLMNLWDRGLNILGTLFGNWKLELVGPPSTSIGRKTCGNRETAD